VAAGCSGFQGQIYITDQVVMLDLMEQNIRLNSMENSVLATVYDWGESTPLGLPSKPDILLAADCVYYEPAFPLLHKTLLDLIGPQTVCYFCFKKRRRADMNCIKTIKKSFDVKEVDDDPDMEIYRRESISL
jgi:predicted nicotinamide N-methyase